MLIGEFTAVVIAGTIVVTTIGPYVVRGAHRFYRWVRYRNNVVVSKTSDSYRFYQLSLYLNRHIAEHKTDDAETSTMQFSLNDADGNVVRLQIDTYVPETWLRLPQFPDIEIEVLGDIVNGVTGYRIWTHRWFTQYGTKHCANYFLSTLGGSIGGRFAHIPVPPTSLMQIAAAEHNVAVAALAEKIAARKAVIPPAINLGAGYKPVGRSDE